MKHNRDWLQAQITKQKCQQMLFGDSMNPLEADIRKKSDQLRKEFVYSFSMEDVSHILPSSNLDKGNSQASLKKEESLLLSHSPDYVDSIDREDLLFVRNKTKDKKKRKKQKKKSKFLADALSDNLLDRDSKNSNLMASLAKASSDMILVGKELWIYNDNNGCFQRSSYQDVAMQLRSSLDEETQMKITSHEYKESYEQLLISDEIQHEDGFFENAPYVNCLNGVVDVMTGELLAHSSDYYFKHCIQANYMPGEKCKTFLAYVNTITGGDKELISLLRQIMGYIFSHYNNAKKAFLIYGIPHTGKSVLCNVIERIIGQEYVSHVDLSMLQRQEYAASLSGKLLNVAPDLKNDSLKDVGFFKSLVSHDDQISARALYGNPQNIKGEAKMLFSTNHLLTFDGALDTYDIEAVFNRLIYFPYQNKPISDDTDNKHLSDDILRERDGIFTWAIKGLCEYVENNECFIHASLSESIKQKNMARYCPEKIFCKECLKRKTGVYESSSSIKDAFDQYCQDNDIRVKGNIARYLEDNEGLKKSKKRIDVNGNLVSDGNPIYVYEGIRLRKRYKNMKEE